MIKVALNGIINIFMTAISCFIPVFFCDLAAHYKPTGSTLKEGDWDGVRGRRALAATGFAVLPYCSLFFSMIMESMSLFSWSRR